MRLFHKSLLAGFLFALPVTSSLAEPLLRVGPVEGMTDAWRSIPDDIELPLGVTVQLEFSWGLNRADLNADGRVDLLDYATLSLCFSAPGGLRPSACDAGNYLAADFDADGDVDIDDANAFNQAMRHPQPYAVESVTWFGAHQVSRTASHTRAELDLREPGEHVVRVEATMTDPITQRTIQLIRQVTINVADLPTLEISASWIQANTPAARGTTNPAVQMLVNAFNPQGRPLDALLVGDHVVFEVGVSLDATYTPPETAGPGGNRGLATLVYNVNSTEASAKGYSLAPIQDAFSGFDFDFRNPQSVGSPFFNANVDTLATHYGGGWGFDRSGLSGGGGTTSPGQIIAAGIAAPLTWTADVEGFVGNQPIARLDAGIGTYTFPADDPILAGRTGGFGADFSNSNAPVGQPGNIDGDGTWLIQFGVIDTTGWSEQTYNFDLILPEGGASLFDGAVDYSTDKAGGFRLGVPLSELGSVAFSFTLFGSDCNSNGVADDLDILGGTSDDCNTNGIPDECEPDEDCNGNTIQDICDIAAGASFDCQQDRVPDECQLTENDCNANSIPDDCETDCNANGIPDECEPDCNGNGIADECDITGGTSQDCNANGIPDECEPQDDCNFNLVLDICDIAGGTSDDCNQNNVPDECDLAAGSSVDCNFNGAPDECELDCNGNAIADTCEIAAGSADDLNHNWVPDECEPSCFDGSATIEMRAFAWNDRPEGLEYVVQGDPVYYQVGVAVDPLAAGGNRGLATLAYDVFSVEAMDSAQSLEPLQDAFSGFNQSRLKRTVSAPLYADGGLGCLNRYGGGWGFDRDGLPGGGTPNIPGQLLGAGVAAPLTWIADVSCASGLQPFARLDVGTGLYTFPPDDPIAGGLQGGFGQVLFNGILIPGDGTWVMQEGVIDTTNWVPQTYSFTLFPRLGAVFDGSLDYTSDLGGGFRVQVPAQDMCGVSFSFALFPFDCNENQFPDDEDIAQGTSQDCNTNRLPDECDISGGTSRDLNSDGVPDECQSWPMDIKPGACSNSFNRSSHGVLPVALLGSDTFDVAQIDPSSLLLFRADGVGGSVAPHEGPPGPHSVLADTATPFVGATCDCHALTADGFTDLSMKFRTDDLVAALELDTLTPGALVELVVSGTLLDGSEFVASDCVRLVPPGTGPGTLTVNSNLPQAWIDVDPLDTQLDGGGFGQFDRTWPQSTVVTLAAEEFYLGQRFVGWKFDGQFASRDRTAAVTVIDQTQTVDALFRRTGDITGDELINLNDFAMFAVCFGKRWGNNLSGACSNEALASADLDRNGVIDLRDFAIFAIHFGT